MKVYRVEHPDYDCGPYVNGHLDCECGDAGECLPCQIIEYGSEICCDHSNDPAHPDPQSDGIVRWNLGLYDVFGFKSGQQLIDWFGDRLEDLDALGFQIGVYEGKWIREGRKQVVFDKSVSERLTSRPLRDKVMA